MRVPFAADHRRAEKGDTVLVGYDENGKRVGETHPNAWISDVMVDRMREMHEDEGMSFTCISVRMAIALTTVKKICTYQRRAATVVRWKRVSAAHD